MPAPSLPQWPSVAAAFHPAVTNGRFPMKVSRALFIALGLTTAASSLWAQGAPAPTAQRVPPMVLTTSAWPDGGQIPAKYTQAGEQLSPELQWTNVPAGARRLHGDMPDPDRVVLRRSRSQPH